MSGVKGNTSRNKSYLEYEDDIYEDGFGNISPTILVPKIRNTTDNHATESHQHPNIHTSNRIESDNSFSDNTNDTDISTTEQNECNR